MKNVFKFIAVIAIAVVPSIAFAGNTLTRGTNVPLRLTNTVQSDQNSTPMVVVDANVTADDGTVLIAQGTPVFCVTQVTPARRVGRPGKVTISPVSVQATDGTSIALDAETLKAVGRNKKGASIGCAVGIGGFVAWPVVFTLMMKGGNTQLSAGTTFNAQVAQ